MKDHTRFFSTIEDRDTSVQQGRGISRRGALLGIAGLVVAGCAQVPATSTLPANGPSSTSSATSASSPTRGTTQAVSSASSNTPVGKTLLIYKGHSENVKAVGWSPQGKYIASAGYDGGVQIWDATNGKAFLVYRGHTTWVGALAWSP